DQRPSDELGVPEHAVVELCRGALRRRYHHHRCDEQHPGRYTVGVQEAVETPAWHDRDHRGQLPVKTREAARSATPAARHTLETKSVATLLTTMEVSSNGWQVT